MKLKDQKKLGILYLVLGAALFLVGLLTDAGEKTNWLSSFTDERAAYVANKARSMALYICIYVQLAAALSAILIFKQTLVGQVLCALTCLQTLVYTGCFWYYNRKY